MRSQFCYSLLFKPATLSKPSSTSFFPSPSHSRLPHLQTRKMSTAPSAPTPVFSSTYSPTQGTADVQPLLRSSGGKWRLIDSGKGLERSFKFKTFKKTWEFMNVIAEECKVKKHHPEWSNVYNTTFIRWTTHSPPGLSEKDVLMSKYCDEQAKLFGEEDQGQVDSAAAKELADVVAKEAGDCCVPKTQKGKSS